MHACELIHYNITQLTAGATVGCRLPCRHMACKPLRFASEQQINHKLGTLIAWTGTSTVHAQLVPHLNKCRSMGASHKVLAALQDINLPAPRIIC